MNFKWILGISVALNAVLLVALQLGGPEPTKSAAASPTASASLPAISRSASDSRGDFSSAEKIERKKAKASSAKESMETDDYPTFVKRLRAAGLGEDTIA